MNPQTRWCIVHASQRERHWQALIMETPVGDEHMLRERTALAQVWKLARLDASLKASSQAIVAEHAA